MIDSEDIGAAVAAQVESARQKARALLLVDGIDVDGESQIRRLLADRLSAGGGIRAVCVQYADQIARQLGAPGRTSHKELTLDGWVILDFGVIRPSHVYAVAALVAADAEAIPVAVAFDLQYLVGEAAFMAGRQGQRRSVEGEAARLRSEAGAKGGRPADRTVSDDDVRRVWAEEVQRLGRERGAQELVAQRLGIDPKTLRKRLRELRIRE